MATYRTIRMDFWNDPYVEGMEPQDKLLYVYLFSSPHQQPRRPHRVPAQDRV